MPEYEKTPSEQPSTNDGKRRQAIYEKSEPGTRVRFTNLSFLRGFSKKDQEARTKEAQAKAAAKRKPGRPAKAPG